ncbi:MAG: hypothetical protein Q4D73_00615 [Actinomycetaceae bacterium]|nr:hypothetical protein [Actinomycetaceae bacterium]
MEINFSELPQHYTFPFPQVDTEAQAEIINYMWSSILAGDDDPNSLVDSVDGILEEDEPSLSQLEEVAKTLIEARRQQLIQWKEANLLTENKLSKAFAQLRSQRILALENFTCCGTCGASEAYEQMSAESGQWDGYIFFHMQDTEVLLENRETYLGYGVYWPSLCTEEQFNAMSNAEKDEYYENACRKMADEILAPVFAQHGIDFSWNRNLDTRMLISNVDYVVDITDTESAE